MGEASRMIIRLLIDFRKKSRHKAKIRGMQRGFSKASRLQRLLVMCEGEPFRGILAQPCVSLAGHSSVSFIIPFNKRPNVSL